MTPGKLSPTEAIESDRLWWDESKDARRFQRIPATTPAVLASTALGRVRATLSDVSQSGCRLTTRARCHVGSHYVLLVEPVGPRLATVVWHRGETVGLRFAELLSWTTVAAIAAGGTAGE